MKYVYFSFLLLLLSACSVPPSTPEGNLENTATLSLPNTPTTLTETPASRQQTWDESPEAIVIQYDEFGGLMAVRKGAHIPLWTLYGDGFVVFAKEGSPTMGFDRQVWVGRIDETAIRELLSFIEKSGFFSLQAEYKAPAFLPQNTEDGSALVLAPNSQAGGDQPTGVIVANFSGRNQRILVYPANWDEAPEAYKAVRKQLLAIQPSDAKLFTPTAFHIEAIEVTARITPTPPTWPFEDVELSQRIDITPDQAQAIHAFLKKYGDLVESQGLICRVNLLASPPR